MMKARLIIIAVLSLSAIGCTSADYDNYKFFPEEYVTNVKYDSIYHYGYNQGCESALKEKNVEDTEYQKDETFDGGLTRFNDGWDAGNAACKNGMRNVMYTLKQSSTEG
ncbi:hypothetical protein [Photobacterium profundum]|uniref:Lipoprotein n=1 Tax=Photobacterium profundum (strain SS9) TaxID=298386 RepID=Q6LQV9_PHOPR|nr:hypothetical protein [Photobacterium profundum]CAG20317.1 hypothetical protein PBPRA1913 [Photobacterium profundum SS9]